MAAHRKVKKQVTENMKTYLKPLSQKDTLGLGSSADICKILQLELEKENSYIWNDEGYTFTDHEKKIMSFIMLGKQLKSNMVIKNTEHDEDLDPAMVAKTLSGYDKLLKEKFSVKKEVYTTLTNAYLKHILIRLRILLQEKDLHSYQQHDITRLEKKAQIISAANNDLRNSKNK